MSNVSAPIGTPGSFNGPKPNRKTFRNIRPAPAPVDPNIMDDVFSRLDVDHPDFYILPTSPSPPPFTGQEVCAKKRRISEIDPVYEYSDPTVLDAPHGTADYMNVQTLESRDFTSLMVADPVKAFHGSVVDVHLDDAVDAVIQRVVGGKLLFDVRHPNSLRRPYPNGRLQGQNGAGRPESSPHPRSRRRRHKKPPSPDPDPECTYDFISKYRKARPESPELRKRCLTILESMSRSKDENPSDDDEPIIVETRSEHPDFAWPSLPPRAAGSQDLAAEKPLHVNLPPYGLFRIKGLDSNGNLELELVPDGTSKKTSPAIRKAAIESCLNNLFHGASEFYSSSSVVCVALENNSIVSHLCQLASSVEATSKANFNGKSCKNLGSHSNSNGFHVPATPKTAVPITLTLEQASTLRQKAQKSSEIRIQPPIRFGAPGNPLSRMTFTLTPRTKPSRHQLTEVRNYFGSHFELTASSKRRDRDLLYCITTCYTFVHNLGPALAAEDIVRIRELTGMPDGMTKACLGIIREHWAKSTQVKKFTPRILLKSENAMFLRMLTMGQCSCCPVHQPCFLNLRHAVVGVLSRKRLKIIEDMCDQRGFVNFFAV